MTRTKAVAAALVAGFVVFFFDGVREGIDPQAAQRGSGIIPQALAQSASCAAARTEELARTWTIRSSTCTECQEGHMRVGDTLTFKRDVSGALAFSADVTPASAGRAASKTDGYTLAADGVGNVTGPIVLGHSALDGTPLQLHWLIVQVRRYDVDGLGDCKLRARAAVCSTEPAAGASSCSSQQHDGMIHLEY